MVAPADTDRILTIPNVISFLRIALIPVFVALIVDPDTTRAGLVLFVIVVATDWVDGALARATGQVSDLGKILDPVADRLAIAAGLIALVVADAFPLWAALLILVRDVTVLIAGLVLLSKRRARIEVRHLGKVATFSLMAAIACIARLWVGVLRRGDRRLLRRNRPVRGRPPTCLARHHRSLGRPLDVSRGRSIPSDVLPSSRTGR